MIDDAFHVGAPIRVVGNICPVQTCIGLFGFVVKVYDDGRCFVRLLSHPTLESADGVRAEEFGNFDTWSATAAPTGLRHLTEESALSRVAALKAVEFVDEDRALSDNVSRVLARCLTPEAKAKQKAENDAVVAESMRIGDVYPLPGRIERGNKSNYPSSCDPLVEVITGELRQYSEAGPKKCSITEMARWRQALAAREATSGWSGRDEVRAVVREFDLDPMTDGYGDALWTKRGGAYVANGGLRALVIDLWNMGAVISQIDDMEDEDTYWSSYKPGEPAGFMVYFAFRRQLSIE